MYGYIICSGGKKNTFKTKLNLRNYCDGTSQRKPSNRNRRKLQKICVTSTTNDTTNQRPDVFKSFTQRTNYSKFLLSRDVEQNPVPTVVDPTKTIAAPYSQGNIAVFGTTNAGRQCVAMSLSALVFNFRKAITSSADLIQVMNIGNCLYSTLLQTTKEMFLLLTDLPTMVSLFETSYDLRFSESYSGFLSGDSNHVTDFPYVMSLAAAFDSLLRENYSSFILTIGSYAVAIYSLANGRYKIFDSHSKDLSGLTHPLGTCTLIEIDSLDNVVQYLHTFHAQTINTTYEVKDVRIQEMHIDNGNDTAGCSEECISSISKQGNLCPCKECCAISFYSICFSTIKSCAYWNSDIVESIAENGKIFYQEHCFGKHTFISDLPNKLEIGTGHVDAVHGARCQGVLSCSSSPSKQNLKSYILDNKVNNTGFLLWISSYCISCIFQYRMKQQLSYNTI